MTQLRENATHPSRPDVTQSKQARLDEIETIEAKLFFALDKYQVSQQMKDDASANFWHTRIEELKLPYARFCA